MYTHIYIYIYIKIIYSIYDWHFQTWLKMSIIYYLLSYLEVYVIYQILKYTWVPVSLTDKVSNGCIRDLEFNLPLHQKLIGVLKEKKNLKFKYLIYKIVYTWSFRYFRNIV